MEEKKTKDAEDTRALFLERIELTLQRERDRAARARAAAFRKGGIPKLRTGIAEYVDAKAGREGAARFVADEWPRIQRGTSGLPPKMRQALDALAAEAFAQTYMILAVERGGRRKDVKVGRIRP